MIYKHQYFKLNTQSKKVFDENNKELKMTGNSFRVISFLCEYGPATITNIGDALDRAKDYDEDHIRQYRYKINTIIGNNVIKYENKVYFIDGEIQKIENENSLILDKNDRNTDLLQPNSVKSIVDNNTTMDQNGYCQKCGEKIQESQRFCVFCGMPFKIQNSTIKKALYFLFLLIVLCVSIYYIYEYKKPRVITTNHALYNSISSQVVKCDNGKIYGLVESNCSNYNDTEIDNQSLDGLDFGTKLSLLQDAHSTPLNRFLINRLCESGQKCQENDLSKNEIILKQLEIKKNISGQVIKKNFKIENNPAITKLPPVIQTAN